MLDSFYKHKPGGYIYLIYNPGNECTKIGYSRGNVKQRMKSLQTGAAERLELAHVIHCDSIACEYFEARLHDMFKINRLIGEWFRLTDEAIEWLKTIVVASQLY